MNVQSYFKLTWQMKKIKNKDNFFPEICLKIKVDGNFSLLESMTQNLMLLEDKIFVF